jgi:hypothetical protein
MTGLLAGFADAEEVGLALLQPLTAAETVTSTGETIVPPLIRVQRAGGPDDGLTDYPDLEVLCFGTDRRNAWQLAEQVRQLILAAQGTEILLEDAALRVTIDHSETTTSPDQVQWADPGQKVVSATYQLQMRRPRPIT